MKDRVANISVSFEKTRIVTAETEDALNELIKSKSEENPRQEFIIVKSYLGIMIPLSVTEGPS